MTYPTPERVTIDWSIHAMTRGIGGITARHHTQGGAHEASEAMIKWLEGLDTHTTIDNAEPSIFIWCRLTSAQILTGDHEMETRLQGLPADLQVSYAVDWLRLVARVKNWGGGR